MNRWGSGDVIVFLILLGVAVSILFAGSGSDVPSRRRLAKDIVELRADADFQKALAAQHQERLDYLRARENAQTVLNKSFIDFGNDTKARLQKLEGNTGHGAGLFIPPQNVPTVPRD